MTITDSIADVKEKEKGPARKIAGPCKSLLVVSAAARSTTAAVETASESATVEATAAMETAAGAAVEVAGSAKAVGSAVEVATAVATADVAASAVVTSAPLVIVATATVTTVSAAAVEAVSVAVEPGTGADEDAAYEIIRSVEAVGCAGVRIIIVVAVGADGRGAVIGRGAKSDAEGDAPGLRVGGGEETNSETNAE